RLSAHDSPGPAVPDAEVVETAGTQNIDPHAVDLGTLIDRHLCLHDGPVTGNVAGVPSEEVQDRHSAVEALAAGTDEVRGGPLEPSGAHPPVRRMPHGGEPVPVTRVAP